jgi:hypothetical protein
MAPVFRTYAVILKTIDLDLCHYVRSVHHFSQKAEAEFLDEIQTKVLRVFFVAIQRKGEKPDRKPYPLPNGLGNP